MTPIRQSGGQIKQCPDNTMGARVIGPEVAKSIVDTWLASEFDPARPSVGNVKAIDQLDSEKPTG
jgi:D-erythrulose 4-phosphate isomerase